MNLYRVLTQGGQQLYVVALSYKDAAEYIEPFTKRETINMIELVSNHTYISDKIVTNLHE